MPYGGLYAAWGLDVAIGQIDRMLGKAVYVQKDMLLLLAKDARTR